MCEWSRQWLLKYHPDKCKIMRIGKKDKPQFLYTLNGQELKYTSEEKDLGVTIDDKLKFNAHISNKVNTANISKYHGPNQKNFHLPRQNHLHTII